MLRGRYGTIQQCDAGSPVVFSRCRLLNAATRLSRADRLRFRDHIITDVHISLQCSWRPLRGETRKPRYTLVAIAYIRNL